MIIPLYLVINGVRKNVEIMAVLGLILIVSVMLFVPSFMFRKMGLRDVGASIKIKIIFNNGFILKLKVLFMSTISPFGYGCWRIGKNYL